MKTIEQLKEFQKNIKNQFIGKLGRNLNSDERTSINNISNFSFLESVERELKDSSLEETEALIIQIMKRF